MKSYISAFAAVGAGVAIVAISPAANAGPRHHGYHGHGMGYSHGRHYRHYGHYRHRRGYWHNGRWIALGIGAAIAAGAAGAYYDRDCYWRNGYRYCD